MSLAPPCASTSSGLYSEAERAQALLITSIINGALNTSHQADSFFSEGLIAVYITLTYVCVFVFVCRRKSDCLSVHPLFVPSVQRKTNCFIELAYYSCPKNFAITLSLTKVKLFASKHATSNHVCIRLVSRQPLLNV